MKTTAKQFEQFQKYCLQWRDELGLTDWHLYFKHGKLQQDGMAQTYWSLNEQSATITLGDKWADHIEADDFMLQETALHELLHLVTAPLQAEAESRYADEYNLRTAEHRIVVKMTNLIMRYRTTNQ